MREDLIAAHGARGDRRRSLVYFGQITDWQLPDEESPGREERFDSDPFARVSTSGYRPQEPLAIQTVEATVRQMNQFLDSPVPQGDGSRARMANAIMTGDLADSMQRNETEWVRTLLEGGAIDPGSGTTDLTGTHCEGLPNPQTLISDFDDPSRYTGVGDYDDYAADSFLYYDPESPAGIYATDNWPTYPNLFDRAQAPFLAEGLGAPTYVVFGNHDALYQGTVSAGPGLVAPGVSFEGVAINCLKLVYPLANEQTMGPPPSPADILAGVASGETALVPPISAASTSTSTSSRTSSGRALRAMPTASTTSTRPRRRPPTTRPPITRSTRRRGCASSSSTPSRSPGCWSAPARTAPRPAVKRATSTSPSGSGWRASSTRRSRRVSWWWSSATTTSRR